jgi:RNA polymerase sigma-70 factor (ECF subfamily)
VRCSQGNAPTFQEANRTVTAAAPSQPVLPRIAAGDADAVQECIDRYGGLVYSLARRFCSFSGADEIEDAVQEIFINVWESAERFDESVASEATFIAMLARRRLIDRRRKQMRRGDSSPLPEAVRDEGPGAMDKVERSDEAAIAWQALQQLRPEQRQVLELSLVYGRTYEQIAQDIDLPIGTVKTHARRGLIRIREELAASGRAARHQEVTT